VASGSRSTTPTYEPGGPPPISPALPPLELKGDVASVDMGGREKKSSGEGKFPFPTSRCVFQREEYQEHQEFKNSRNDLSTKVILNTTNLRYILLSLNTIHCSQFPTKKTNKHASLRCTIHLHLHRKLGHAASSFLDLASRGSCSHIQFGEKVRITSRT